jgi:putative molybdopterin biosynthesis protein
MLASEPPPIVGGSQDSLLEWSPRDSGSGLASRGAAESAGLDLVPLLWENFDLAMRQRAEELTGYDPSPAGQIRFAT